jgi:ferritin-like protein
MAASSGSLHEAAEKLQPGTIDRHRALVSVMEELEAIDWYDQRVEGAEDPELKQILAHNRDEEKEHASMLLEWLRRRDAKLEHELRDKLFRDGPIVREEASPQSPAPAGDGSLGLGSLREAR